MKGIAVIVTVIISIIVLFSGCEVQKNGSNIYENSIKQKPDAIEASPDVSSAKLTDKNTIKTSPDSLPITTTEISTKELKKYLKLKKSEIMQAEGINTETGSISVPESHMVFPFIFIKDLGLAYIFPNEIDDLNPTYINVNGDTNIKNINIKGAVPGMEFKDIINKLGSAQIKKTWISSEYNIAYRIDYELDEVIYSFVSYDEKGTNSELFVFLADN